MYEIIFTSKFTKIVQVFLERNYSEIINNIYQSTSFEQNTGEFQRSGTFAFFTISFSAGNRPMVSAYRTIATHSHS